MSEIIEKRVVLESKYLNNNYKTHLLTKIKSNITSECTEDYGHIIDIIKIIDIISHKIDRTNSDNIFNIRFEAKTLKPTPGKIMEGVVCMI
jgi:DNA-directed RNA polymerase subunit E'/Rpb7